MTIMMIIELKKRSSKREREEGGWGLGGWELLESKAVLSLSDIV
jgi:hypothetical protein